MATVDIHPDPVATAAPRVGWVPKTAPALPGQYDHPWLCRFFLFVWCGALFFYGLSAGQLWKTEGLRAIIAAEFLRTGNWIVPTLYGEPLFTKPPGMYAAIALASLPFGQVTEWTARMPSAMAALLTVLMLYGYFTRLFGRRGGLLIAVLAPMSPLWLDKGTAAEIDMMQVMWVTGSILCLLRALENVDGGQWTVDRRQRHEIESREYARWTAPSALSTVHRPPSTFFWWLAALLCVAGGVLTKWTAPAFFYATAVPLLLWRGQLRLLFGWHHLLAAAIGASLVLAWIGVAVAIAGWDIFYETVKREALQRMLPGYSPTPDPWYVSLLHPFRLWYNNWPWSLVALVACKPGFGRLWDERGRLLWQTLHCWIWPNIVIWSLMLDHKPRHSFPLFPAFAGLAAMVWLAWLDGRLPLKWRVKPGRILVGSVVCWLALKLIFVHVILPHRQHNRDPRGKAAILASLVPQNSILYLFQIKDEGIMFYFGRPVLRLDGPADLPSSAEPLYCIVKESEWDNWRQTTNRQAVPVTTVRDEQGDPMVLIRVQNDL